MGKLFFTSESRADAACARSAGQMGAARRVACLLLPFVLLCLCGCEKQPETKSKMLDGPLDTVSTITLYDWSGGEEPIDEIFEMLGDIDSRMSSVSLTSEPAAISAGAGSPVAVSQDTFGLIRYAQTVSAETGGAFDITVRPVVFLWGVGTENARVPAQTEIDAVRQAVGYDRVSLDETALSVALADTGMQLDLGGIAKGYACDRAVEILRNAKVGHAIIDMGGNIYACGTKPDGSPWRVGVKSPLVGENGHFGIVSAADRAVVTSGVYERFFETDGKLYHHIMDPRTGRPVDNALLSVTIISESSTQADALSTACFVLGAERGLEYLETLPGVEGIFVGEDLRVWISSGLRDSFQMADKRFALVGDDEEG